MRHCFKKAGLFLLLVLLLTGCDYIVNWPEISGEVYDKETGKPVENAFVIATWWAYWGGTVGGGTTGCMHAEVVRTDANGRYAIPAWKNASDTKWLQDQRAHLYSYAPGYRLSSAGYKQGMASTQDFSLLPGSEKKEARLDELRNSMQAAECFPLRSEGPDADYPEYDYAIKQLVQVWRAIFKEACSLNDASNLRFTQRQEEFSQAILFGFLIDIYGDQYAYENYKNGCDYEWN